MRDLYKVGANMYKVDYSILDDCIGECDYDSNTITIDGRLAYDRKFNVLVHELLHAMLFEAGYLDHDEDLVMRLGNVLTLFLLDNFQEGQYE